MGLMQKNWWWEWCFERKSIRHYHSNGTTDFVMASYETIIPGLLDVPDSMKKSWTGTERVDMFRPAGGSMKMMMANDGDWESNVLYIKRYLFKGPTGSASRHWKVQFSQREPVDRKAVTARLISDKLLKQRRRTTWLWPRCWALRWRGHSGAVLCPN